MVHTRVYLSVQVQQKLTFSGPWTHGKVMVTRRQTFWVIRERTFFSVSPLTHRRYATEIWRQSFGIAQYVPWTTEGGGGGGGYRYTLSCKSWGGVGRAFSIDPGILAFFVCIHSRALPLCLSACQSACLPFSLSLSLSLPLCLCLSVCLSLSVSVSLSLSVSVSLSVSLSVCLSVSLSVCLSVCLSVSLRPFMLCTPYRPALKVR